MSDKTISIIFPQGGIIPGSVLGAAEDKHVDALTPVSVPERYGRHLIADRFAVETPEVIAAAEKARKKAASKKGAAEKAAVDKTEAEKQAEIADAEKNLAEAQALLAASGDDLVGKGEAEAMVTAAEAALASLKA